MITAIKIYNQSVYSSTNYTHFILLYDNLNEHEMNLQLSIYQVYNRERKNSYPFMKICIIKY